MIRPIREPRTHKRAALATSFVNRKVRERHPGIPELFPLTLDVHYTSKRRSTPASGSGRSIEMSSSAFRFIADRPLAPGLPLHLAIDWPVLLDGDVPLQLIATGEVVWTSGTETFLKIQRHEMRTARRSYLDIVR